MKTMQFPKLQYPLNTKGLSQEERLIALAYDLIWKNTYEDQTQGDKAVDFLHDTYANLMQLGAYVEHHIGHLRFETIDDQAIFHHDNV